MVKRDNEFGGGGRKKKPPITRLSGLEIFRSIDGGIKIKREGEGNRKADTFFVPFFSGNPRERTFFRFDPCTK